MTETSVRKPLPARGEDRLQEHLESLTASTRFRISEQDRTILRFLSHCRYSPSKHLSTILGVSERAARQRMERLYRRGYLERQASEGVPNIYYLGTLGRDLIDSEDQLSREDFNPLVVRRVLEANRLIAGLLAGEATELGCQKIGQFDYSTRQELERASDDPGAHFPDFHYGFEGELIAVEVEVHLRPEHELVTAVESYRDRLSGAGEPRYDRVVWLAKSEKMLAVLEEAVAAAGLGAHINVDLLAKKLGEQ